MYPPLQEWNSWIQVKVTFWFWLMYPPQTEIGLNMNAIGKKSSTFYQSTPPLPIIIIWFYAWTGNWWISISNGYMDLNPIHHPSPAKKIKCSFLDYVQLLMIGRAIWAKNIDRNAKKWKRPPKSFKNQMFIFGLRSTSDDWPSDLSKKCQPKHKKMKKAP